MGNDLDDMLAHTEAQLAPPPVIGIGVNMQEFSEKETKKLDEKNDKGIIKPKIDYLEDE